MTTADRETLSGWGLYPRVPCEVARPRSEGEIPALLDRPAIARGLGRSYGDAAVLADGRVVTLTALDGYRAFDEQTGVLDCGAGVSLAQILRDFAPRGFLPSITPGTKFVTVGGCIANDVHGKAHHVQGSFERCVDSLRLLLADGSIVEASRHENPELFAACFGGMGLLGVILSARIRLRRVETTWFRQRAFVARDLDEMFALMERYDAEYPYSVANINPFDTGRRLGRGVLTVGDHASADELPAGRDRLRVSGPPRVGIPFALPRFVINPVSARVLQWVIGQVLARGAAYAHYEKFFYPLDAIDHWNRGYGPRGFTQYQFVVPLADGARRVREILDTIARSGQLPILNVLKRMGKSGVGPLSFPMEGYTLAIDFPIRDGLRPLLQRLDAMVLDAGGRIYLGKDAFLEPATFAAMYPRLDEFRAVRARVDPGGVFQSALSRRLAI
jgi:FAD/FMN-containing dehydrogenase